MRDTKVCEVCKKDTLASKVIQQTCRQLTCENNARYKCWNEHKSEDDNCYGMLDCDKTQDYMASTCMDCPYLRIHNDTLMQR